ncbi:oligosaccharide flippase family protein [Candidatus Pacearchaeota archaeon]|nr:oligosaccharide flippase family protein [Candidatus Pacearchaeota archaeon]
MRKTAINISSNVLTRFIPLLAALVLTPFIIKQVGIENYGVWAIVGSFVSISLMFDLGLGFTVEKEIAKLSNNKEEAEEDAANFLFTFFPYQLVISVVLTAVVAIVLFLGLQWVKVSDQATFVVNKSMGLILVLAFLKYWIGTCESIIRGLEKHYILVFRNVVYIVFYAVFILSILPKYKNVFGLVLCDLLATCVLLVVFIKYLFRTIKFDKKLIRKVKLPKKIFSFSRDAFTLQICALFIFNFGKIMLGGMVSALEVAYYEIGNKIFQILRNVFDQIARVFLPKAAKTKDDKKIKYYIEEGTFLLLSLWGAVSIPLLICLKDFIVLWLGKDLIKSVPVAIVLIISIGFIVLSRMSLNIFMGIGKLVRYIKIRIISTILFVVFTLFFIPKFKALGLAYSMLIYAVFSEAVVTSYSFRVFGLNFWYFIKTRVIKLVLLQVLLGLALYNLYKYMNKSYIAIIGLFVIYNVLYLLAYYKLILMSRDKLFIKKEFKKFLKI